jgi:hypothetical protein
MKAYIIKIELIDSQPLIWRRVIMPAGATFGRLHETIQRVTAFMGGDYHLYEFDLKEENMIVTNDEDAYLEHLHYMDNIAYFEERLKDMDPALHQFEIPYQERLKIKVRKPQGLKIDDYLEKYKEVTYAYDFGDDWHFDIKLEAVVTDYYFGYPTLLDGAETAPPEDVGGLSGYYEFIEAYRNPSHPEHKNMVSWVSEQYFREYDLDWTNYLLKSINYKKTEWDKINHNHFKVIEDKYRKSEGVTHV